MNSSIVNKSILAVVMLVMACFAGVAVVDDVDAAGAEYTVKLDNKVASPWESGVYYDNAYFGNNVSMDGDKIVGSVTSGIKADTTAQKLYGSAAAPEGKNYILVFTIQNLPQGYYVSYMADGKLKSSAVGEGENAVTDLTMLLFINEENKNKSFTYAVTPAEQTGDSLAGLVTYDIPIDLKMDVVSKDIKYTYLTDKGALTTIQVADSGTEYLLVGLDAFTEYIPEGKTFVGWSDSKTLYKINSMLTLEGDKEYAFAAVYEDLPAQVIFNVDFVVDGTVIQKTTSDAVQKPANPVKEGFVFQYWAVDGEMANPVNYSYSEDVQFVAVWKAETLTVTFMAGGEIVGTPQTVLYGDKILAPALPAGYESWNFDFTQPIKADTIITAVEAPEPEPTGADDPMTLTVYILVAFVIIGLIACFVYLLREGRIVIGLGKKKEIEAPVQEEPKQ